MLVSPSRRPRWFDGGIVEPNLDLWPDIEWLHAAVGGPLIDFARHGYYGSLNGAVSLGAGPRGRAFVANPAAEVTGWLGIEGRPLVRTAGTPLTVLALIDGVTETRGPIFALRSSASGNPILAACVGYNGVAQADGGLLCIVRDDAGTINYDPSSGGTINDGAVHLVAIRIAANGAPQRSLDGAPFTNIAPGTAIGTVTFTADRQAYFSERQWVADSFSEESYRFLGGRLYLGAALRAEVSDAQIAEIWRNPWTLVKRQTRSVYIGAGGGAITGTAAITFGAGSTTITGKGVLAGSAALAFGASSTATGKGAVAGSAALTFAAAGTVAGKGAIAGSAALTFAATGTATGKGALAATSALTFDAEGTLLNAAAGSVAGTSAITFAPTGTLTGKGALAATGAMAFAGAGTATGKGALTGQSDVLFTLAGALDGVVGGVVAGTAALAFTPTGTLTGKGALAGASAMIFVPTARSRAIGAEVYASSAASGQRARAGRMAQTSGRARAAQAAARRRIN